MLQSLAVTTVSEQNTVFKTDYKLRWIEGHLMLEWLMFDWSTNYTPSNMVPSSIGAANAARVELESTAKLAARQTDWH